MALFPILEIEEKVQVGDKTRVSGIKSFISKGETPTTTMTVTPGLGGTPFSIFNADSKERYTDWAWPAWASDIDSFSNKIDFEEGGVVYAATVSSSTYTSFSAYISAIQTALNAAGAAGTFTVSIDQENKITIASTVSFKLLARTGVNFETSLLRHIGFGEVDTTYVTSIVGQPLEYGLKKITLTMGNGTLTETLSLYQKLYTKDGDRLFATDSDLTQYEPDILKWVPPGRSSYKDVHRRVQENLMSWLDGEGYRNIYGGKLTKFDVRDTNQVRELATLMALSMIFSGNSNAVDDVFAKKVIFYDSKIVTARRRFISMDLDADGIVDENENLPVGSGSIFLR